VKLIHSMIILPNN